MIKFQISLSIPTFKALRDLASLEFRDPRAQAALIVQNELIRLGLLISEINDHEENLDNERLQQTISGGNDEK